MKVLIEKLNKSSTINSNHRKESVYSDSIIVLDEDRNVVVDCRFYYTRVRVYCCVWIKVPEVDIHIGGSDYAGGYGYDKQSAALDSALMSMGIYIEGLHATGLSQVGLLAVIREIYNKYNLTDEEFKVIHIYG